MNERRADLLQALVVLLLPTSFFYSFLFYTDMGALAAVLATLLVCLLTSLVALSHDLLQ